ncbi:MAG: CDC48 family AAA ATPase [Thermoprotei archaeon]|nr:CDC48 family AAA ATPase [TACK group archaeon]
MSEKSVLLTVQEAMARDVGRMIARIGSKTMAALGARVGDYVSIKGNKTAYATVWPAAPQDEGTDIIRIDGIIRENAGASIGDLVEVKRVELRPLTRLSLAPTEQIAFGADFRALVAATLQGKPVAPGNLVIVPVMGQAIRLYATAAIPANGGIVVDSTEIMISSEAVSMPSAAAPMITYEDIGDMEDAKQKVREIVELPLKHPELFKHLGIDPPKGILLYGPPGTGKTLLARAIANETNSNFFTINGPEIMSKFYGESEERLREIFNKAEARPPSIIFIDEIDAIAPRREDVSGEVEKRVVAQLLTSMDGLKSRGNVIVIGATNRIDAVDPALRRPGRFDREIETGIPDAKGRRDILQVHTRNMPLADDVNLDQLAEITHGFTGADLSNLVKEAAMSALRRVLPSLNLKEGMIPTEVLSKIKVQNSDFETALRMIQPSALREFYVEVPEAHWEDVGGLDEVKQRLKEAVEWPLKHPDYFQSMGIQPVKGVLLYGPPGTGKTLLAKVVATESEANFISVKGPEVLNKWVGESERAIRDIFRKARQSAPCVIFFDELDAIAPVRGQSFDSGVTERIVNQLLSEMDGISPLKNVVVMGATNRADILDPALLRPGRFDQIIYVPPPDQKARLEILKIHTKRVPLADDVSLEKLAAMTEGYSGADLYALVRQSAIIRLRKENKPSKVTMEDFTEAMNEIRPSITRDQLLSYEKENKRLQGLIV